MYFTSNKLVLFTLSSFQSTRLNDQFVLLVVRLRSLLTDYHFISKIVRSKTSCRLITCAFSDFCVPQYMFTSFLNMVSWCEIMFFFITFMFVSVWVLCLLTPAVCFFISGGDRDEGEDTTGDLRRTESDGVLKKVSVQTQTFSWIISAVSEPQTAAF